MPLATRHIGSRRPHYSPDGEWEFVRGPFGWSTIHVPTHWDTGLVDAYLRNARANVDNPVVYAALRTQAWIALSRIEDVITYDDGSTISTHDHARGLLTWLADNRPELFAAPA
jgi:hypothetical protein